MSQVILDYAGPKLKKRAIARPIVTAVLAVSILLLLAAIVMPKLTGRCIYPPQAAALSDITSFRTALNIFEVDNGRYPTTAEGLQVLQTNPGNLPNWRASVDPPPYAFLDPWGHRYIYQSLGNNAQAYQVFSAGADGIPNTQDDVCYPMGVGDWIKRP